MRVVLTDGRHQAARWACDGDQRLLDELAADVVPSSGRHGQGHGRVTVDAAYVAWTRVRDGLAARAFTRAGTHNGEVPRMVARALGDVVRAMNALDAHPALRGLSMIGFQPGRFPVWQINPSLDTRGRIWTPEPQPGRLFAVLEPFHHEGAGGSRFTTWMTGLGLMTQRLDDERLHLALLAREPADESVDRSVH